MSARGLLLAAALLVVTAAATAAGVWYEEAAEAAGVRFQLAGEVHDPELDWPSLVETVGGGACFADFDGDGLTDLYLVNQRYNRENPATAGWIDSVRPTNKMYINEGDGTFRDVTAEAGVESADSWGFACSAADYDGDGFVDLFVSNFGLSELYRNDGDGTFTNVTAEAGLAGLSCGEYACMSVSSAWGDYDSDGDLDLYVTNHVETDYQDRRRGPRGHIGQENFLLRNEGDGTFTEVARLLGVQGNHSDDEGSKSFGVVWFDADLDGDLDLYVVNDETPNDYYVNHGNGTFTEMTDFANLGDVRASMGVASGDYDNDGYPDLFFTHYSFEQNGFYRNLGNGRFEDRSGEDDLKTAWTLVGWGCAFVDFDRDGDLDIVSTNGHTEWATENYGQRTQLYRNDPESGNPAQGDRKWVDVSHLAGPALDTRKVTRGAAFADYDYDGDTDMVLVNNANDTAQLLRASAVENRWLTVLLEQPGLNRDAIGARVVLEVAGLPPQTREVQAGSSYLSQNALDLEFGLGGAAKADRVTVHWPGGGTTVVTDVPADRVVRIDRATGAVEDDTLSPLTRILLEGSPGADGWWHSEVTATVEAADRGVARVSGVALTERALGDGAWEPHGGESFTFGEGEHRVHARSADAAGNVEPRRSAVVRVDLTPPTATHALAGTRGESGWWTSPEVTVTLAGEDALSGLAGFRYRLGGGAWAEYEGPFDVSGEGVNVLEYAALDVAGNVGRLERVEVPIDSVAPAVALTTPDIGHVYVDGARAADLVTGPAYVVATPLGDGRFRVVAAASDAASGVARVDFILDGWTVATDAAHPHEWTWDTREHASGLHGLAARAVDAAGHDATHAVRVVLASATPEGVASTARDGPSRHVGIGPVDGAGAESADGPGVPPASALPALLFLAAVRRVGVRRRGLAFVAALAVAALAPAALAQGVGVWYEDATEESGIEFQLAGEVHDAEIDNFWPSFPEVNGSGACWGDFDGDGLLDLYLVNQRYNPESPISAAWIHEYRPTNKLYANDGDGTFTDVTEAAGVGGGDGFGYACSAADYDGDLDLDLFVSNFGVSVLYRNDGDGTFTNATAEARLDVVSCDEHPCNSMSSAWGDYDLDGDLDLYVTNYVDTNLTDIYRGPNGHVAQENWLFRNEGDGTFTEVARAAGVEGEAVDVGGSKSMGVVWFDADLDGDLDLYVANDETPNDYYVNNGDGTFEDRSDASGLADTRASMGLASGDYDHDGYPDLYITHYRGQHNGFYRNLGNHTYEDRSGEEGLGEAVYHIGWGTAFVDVDRDGDLDVVVTNGGTEWATAGYGQETQVFRNDPSPDAAPAPGDRHWVDITRGAGPGLDVRKVTRGAAFADYDHDGDTDMVLVNNNNDTAQVLEASEVEGRWLTVRLRQDGMNRDGIGARVVLEAAGLPPQHREVQAGSSYMSQNALDLEFGLGQAARADRITVHWPGGGTTVVEDVPADRVVRIDRATGRVVADTVAPLTRVVLDGEAGESGWWRSADATLAAEDRAVGEASGVVVTELQLDGAPWRAWDGEAIFLAEGEHRLRGRSVDAEGNVEAPRWTTVRVDSTPPTASHALSGTGGENGWWVSEPVTVTLSAADATSGVDRIEHRLDGGAWQAYEAPFEVGEDGAHVLEYRVVDVAGNVGRVERVELRVDRTAPTVVLSRPDIGHVYVDGESRLDLITGPAYVVTTPEAAGLGGGPFRVEADPEDATSGVARVEFLLNERHQATDDAGPAYDWTWAAHASPSGVYVFRAAATDAAGNEASTYVRVVVASATEAGAIATAREGPSRHVGIGPVDDADGNERAPHGGVPPVAVAVLALALVRRARR